MRERGKLQILKDNKTMLQRFFFNVKKIFIFTLKLHSVVLFCFIFGRYNQKTKAKISAESTFGPSLFLKDHK